MIRTLLIINFFHLPNFYHLPNFLLSAQFFTVYPIFYRLPIFLLSAQFFSSTCPKFLPIIPLQQNLYLIKHDSFISSILYYDKFYIVIRTLYFIKLKYIMSICYKFIIYNLYLHDIYNLRPPIKIYKDNIL